MKQDFWLTTDDNCELYVRHWGRDLKDRKAVLLISHGMTEHIGRYEHVAAYFNEKGYIVYGDDHRGHGETGVKQGQLGFIANEDGFGRLVQDTKLIIDYIKKEHPSLPIFIFGHSMGSFIIRNYIQTCSQEIAGVILSGSGFFPKQTSKLGLELASRQDPRKESAFMNNLVFGNYNNKIVERLTSFDWLTRDREIVEAYVSDPLSGYVPSAGFFVDLLTGILTMQDDNMNLQIRKDLPILFISGDADPVGNYSKGIFQAAERYVQTGLEDITVAIYAEARHELHNEINKEEVFEYVNHWLAETIRKRT